MAQRKKKYPKARPAKTSIKQVVLPEWFTNATLHRILLFVFSFLLYANTLKHDYTLDDAIVIYDNMYTTEGVQGIPGILKYDTFKGFFKVEGKDQLVSGGRYRPFTLLMFALEVELFGQSPFAGHLFNVGFYGLTVIMLYNLLLLLFRRKGNELQAFFLAISASLLFAAHPVHTEAVANIKGRDEIMTLLFSLAALYFSVKAYKSKKLLPNILAAVLFFCGLLSKENAITFLAVVPLTYLFFTKAKASRIAIQTLPFLGAAVVFLLIRFSILGNSLGDTSMELMNNPFLKLQGGQYVAFSGSEKLATILFTMGDYIRLLFFPHPLTHDYYPMHVSMKSWGDWQVLLSLLFYLGLVLVAIKGWRKKSILSFGILFFLLTFSIVSNILFPVGTFMSERFVFMPSVGVCLAVSYLLYEYLAKAQKAKIFKIALPVLGLVLLLFAMKTFSRNKVWKDNLTLFTTDVEVSKNSAKLRNAAGGELITQWYKQWANVPEAQRDLSDLLKAETHLEEAIKIHPYYKNAYLLKGNCYNYQRKYDESIQAFQSALAIDPNYQEAKNNIAITYREAGQYYGEQKGDLNRAIQNLEKARELDPSDYETLRLLGTAYGIGGNNPKAISYFQQALSKKPNNADAHYNLATAYYQAGQQEKADEHFSMAMEIDPEIQTRRQGVQQQ